MSKSVHASPSRRMRKSVRDGQVCDPVAQNHGGFAVGSVKKNLGSFGRLVEGLPAPVLHASRWVFHPILGTKHENRGTQKQCKGVKETFHPYTKM